MPADRTSREGRLVIRPGSFNGIKVFSATMFAERDALGDKITNWMRDHPEYEIVEIVQTQSSDASFHCLTLTIFYRS